MIKLNWQKNWWLFDYGWDEYFDVGWFNYATLSNSVSYAVGYRGRWIGWSRPIFEFIDKCGFPVERIKGRPIVNVMRLLIHTRKIKRC